jgi:polyisoprenoid-binding protein YceI
MKALLQNLLLCACCALPSLPAVAAHEWTPREGGRLGFVASWEGIEFEGVFHEFDAAVSFDPADLPGSRFDVKVDVTSADTQSADRDEGLADPEWFDYAKYPQATFESSSIKSIGDGKYEAAGKLTIKGVTHDITFPFAWEEHDRAAHLTGHTVLRRTDYHIGEGEWAEDDTVGFDVRVKVDLTLDGKTQ